MIWIIPVRCCRSRIAYLLPSRVPHGCANTAVSGQFIAILFAAFAGNGNAHLHVINVINEFAFNLGKKRHSVREHMYELSVAIKPQMKA